MNSKFVYIVEYLINKKTHSKRFDVRKHAESFAKMNNETASYVNSGNTGAARPVISPDENHPELRPH